MNDAFRLVRIVLLMLYGVAGLCAIMLVQKIKKGVQTWMRKIRK